MIVVVIFALEINDVTADEAELHFARFAVVISRIEAFFVKDMVTLDLSDSADFSTVGQRSTLMKNTTPAFVCCSFMTPPYESV